MRYTLTTEFVDTDSKTWDEVGEWEVIESELRLLGYLPETEDDDLDTTYAS